MKQVLDKMLELETFNEVLDMLRQIIDAQEKVNAETKQKQKQKAARPDRSERPADRPHGSDGRGSQRENRTMLDDRRWRLLARAAACSWPCGRTLLAQDDAAEPTEGRRDPAGEVRPATETAAEPAALADRTAASRRAVSRAGKAAAADGRVDRADRSAPRGPAAPGRRPEQTARHRPPVRANWSSCCKQERLAAGGEEPGRSAAGPGASCSSCC